MVGLTLCCPDVPLFPSRPPTRLTAAHVPEGTAFATKPALAVEMIKRAIANAVPFSWVAADAVYGVGDIEGSA